MRAGDRGPFDRSWLPDRGVRVDPPPEPLGPFPAEDHAAATVSRDTGVLVVYDRYRRRFAVATPPGPGRKAIEAANVAEARERAKEVAERCDT